MAADVIDRIFGLFERHGAAHYGENASQLQHALQTAALAREAGCSDSLIAAALLHDIGQLLGNAGEAADSHGIDAQHEATGARYLNDCFNKEVFEPVRLHVAAKRYLCAIEPDYFAGLSRASVLSLRLQGGPMDHAEVAAFEAEPFFTDAVTLRRFDDLGKQADWHPAGLETYRALLKTLIAIP